MTVDNPDHPMASWPGVSDFRSTAEAIVETLNDNNFEEIDVDKDSDDTPVKVRFVDPFTGRRATITIEETS